MSSWPSDIKDRAREYAESTFGPHNGIRQNVTLGYIAGATAEIELERKRILSELLKLVYEDWGISISKEYLTKIIEGDGV